MARELSGVSLPADLARAQECYDAFPGTMSKGYLAVEKVGCVICGTAKS